VQASNVLEEVKRGDEGGRRERTGEGREKGAIHSK